MKHILSKLTLAIALTSAIPAQAQLTTIDPGHIAVNVTSWAEDLLQWKKQFDEWGKNLTQWTSVFTSAKAGVMGSLEDAFKDDGSEALEKVVSEMIANSGCNKIKEEGSKGLCVRETDLKVDRARIIVQAMKDSSADVKQINLKVAQHNVLQAAAQIGSMGSKSNTNEGQIRTIEAEIESLQAKVNQTLEAAQKKVQQTDSLIGMVHGLRVDYARAQIEGKEPGLFDKLVSTAAVAKALDSAKDGYKDDIDTIKRNSKTKNNY